MAKDAINQTGALYFQYQVIYGDIDVGDGCWRPNVLMTSWRCW